MYSLYNQLGTHRIVIWDLRQHHLQFEIDRLHHDIQIKEIKMPNTVQPMANAQSPENTAKLHAKSKKHGISS